MEEHEALRWLRGASPIQILAFAEVGRMMLWLECQGRAPELEYDELAEVWELTLHNSQGRVRSIRGRLAHVLRRAREIHQQGGEF